MQRRNFLIRISSGAAAALAATPLAGCLSQPDTRPNTDVDFTLDLSQLSQLTNPGGFVIKNNVLVARTLQGDYVAATVICSHEQQKKITYDDGKNQFHCTAHDVRFVSTGHGLNSSGNKNLTGYHTAVEGNKLGIFS